MTDSKAPERKMVIRRVFYLSDGDRAVIGDQIGKPKATRGDCVEWLNRIVVAALNDAPRADLAPPKLDELEWDCINEALGHGSPVDDGGYKRANDVLHRILRERGK